MPTTEERLKSLAAVVVALKRNQEFSMRLAKAIVDDPMNVNIPETLGVLASQVATLSLVCASLTANVLDSLKPRGDIYSSAAAVMKDQPAATGEPRVVGAAAALAANFEPQED